MILNGRMPSGPLNEKWDRRKEELRLIAPSNKRKYKIIVVGTGLAGASAAATLGELGYNVEAFCIQDSPRRGHSIAAQGGINAAKNYANDNDSIYRFFYDTIKGGDFRSREANVFRLAQISNNIIDPGIMPATLKTVPLEVPLSYGHFMPGDRQVSNSCSAPTELCQGR